MALTPTRDRFQRALNHPIATPVLQNLHLWIPNIFEFKGGIQVYSAFLLNALQSLYPEANYTVCLKHDTQRTDDLSFLPHTLYHFAGHIPLKWRTLGFSAQLLTAGLSSRPDLILSTHLNFTEVAYRLKQMRGIPYWAIAHGVDAWNLQKPSLIHALRHADQILAVSQYTRDRLLAEQDLDPDRVSLLPNTVDAERFTIGDKPMYLLERYHLRPDQPIILTVARLDSQERYKGYDQILRALPSLRQTLPDLHYIIAGTGSDRPRIEHLIMTHHLQDCVTLAGFVPDHELTDHYNLCDVFAMPSKGEGFGIVYLEALACGKPVIGGNQDGAIDALCQGELGVLVDPDDVDAIAHALAGILQRTYPHPVLYQPAQLRQRVLDAFGVDRFRATLQERLQAKFWNYAGSSESRP